MKCIFAIKFRREVAFRRKKTPLGREGCRNAEWGVRRNQLGRRRRSFGTGKASSADEPAARPYQKADGGAVWSGLRDAKKPVNPLSSGLTEGEKFPGSS